MNAMIIFLRALLDRKGVTALEYGVIAAAIVIGVATVLVTVGPQVSGVFTTVGGSLPAAGG
ncbi:MAG: Flp family type IVb pilin [Geminicoccaceae bacterium]